MNEMILSILLVLIGLFVGIITMNIVNYIKNLHASNKIEKMLENAKLEAEKLKRDNILEAKEDAILPPFIKSAEDVTENNNYKNVNMKQGKKYVYKNRKN